MMKINTYGWSLPPGVYYGAVQSGDYYREASKVALVDRMYIDRLYTDWLQKKDEEYYVGKYVDVQC